MNKILRDRLIEAVKLSLNECGDSSKEMIANNIVRFEQTGMANAANPGEFAPEEITDVKNLENTASMANDTDFNKDDNCDHCDMVNDLEKSIEDLTSDLINISVKDEEQEEKPMMESSFRKNLTRTLTESNFGEEESSFVKSIKKNLLESDYAAPLKYVPDTRINAADVLNALKANIGDGSEALHITCELDEEGNKIFSVSQIDKDKLPKEIDVENVTLKLGDEGYSIEKTVSDFPVKKG
jgi:hypothetical protein